MRGALAETMPTGLGEAVIWLKPRNEHRLELSLAGRIGRTLARDDVLALAEALIQVPPKQGQVLLAAFLPGFSADEYAALTRAVAEFSRLIAIEGERDNPRSWSNAVRVPL